MTAEATLLHSLQEENSQQRIHIQKLENKLHELTEQLEWFHRQIFGKRSERVVKDVDPNILYLEGLAPSDVVPQQEKRTIPTHERKKPNRNGQDAITLDPDLPVERCVLDIPEEDKICKETGQPLVKIGDEVTHKLAHKPGSYYVKEIVRPKYALPQNSSGGILTAPLPESLLSRCQADESFLADILVKKFADHLPLYRIQEIMSRDGVGISRQLLSKWVLRCGEALRPLHEEMKRKILESGNAFIDESPVDMLKPGKGKAHQGYMWVLAGGKEANPAYRVYEFRLNRQHSHAKELLTGYTGIMHSDKYGAYAALANREQIIWCPCWAHIRRKFFDVESGDLEFRDVVIRKIRHLYMLERVAWARSEEERLRIRKEKEEPIIDQLIAMIKKKLIDGKILPKSKFREALGYFTGLIPYLKNYLHHPYAHIDNNVAERAIRPLAIGRKNWLFFGNEEGGEAGAIILSLVQTCRALGIAPREYLEDVMRRLMSHSANKLHELLPDQWALARR